MPQFKRTYKRRRKGSGYYQNGIWISLEQSDEVRGFIQSKERESGYIVKMMPGFFKEYEEQLNEVCGILAEELNEKLHEYIREDAYSSGNTDYWYKTEPTPAPTYQFLNAWDVIVFVGRRGRLRMEPRYYPDDLELIFPEKTPDDNKNHFALHGSNWSGKKIDVREFLGEILNRPNQYRTGRWYERFLNYCNSYGVGRFIELCNEYGIIIN